MKIETNYNYDTNEEKTDSNFLNSQTIKSNLDGLYPKTMNGMCPLCGEWNTYDTSNRRINCTSCNTELIVVSIVDAQTECSRCKTEVFRERGKIIMECTTCKQQTSVIQCQKCKTPFIFPWGLDPIPCASCGTVIPLSQVTCTPPMKFGLLVNKENNEPESMNSEFESKKVLNKPINLITQYYLDGSPERQKEIDYCLQKNIECTHIDKIYLLLETENSLPEHFKVDKVITYNLGSRWKFKDAFEYCNKELSGEICIVANSDIYFDQTLNYIARQRIFTGQFIALTRYDETKDGNIRFNDWTAPISQDSWIFESPLPLDTIDTDYYFGYNGCDNRIVYEIKYNARPAYHLYNPTYLIVSRHVHKSNIRNTRNKVEGNYSPLHPNQDI